jgi:photosystem II stability/assembly factor-like uncharacterized protein
MNKRFGFPNPLSGAAFALMIAVICMTASAAETWRQIPGPDRCSLPAMALFSHDNVLFVGTSVGVFRSTNGGRDWKQSNEGLTAAVLSFAASGSSLFAGMHSGGVFRSIDHGQTWTHMNITGQVNALAASGPNVFAGMRPKKSPGVILYRSTDNGETWAPADAGLSGTGLLALSVAGANLFAGTESGAYRSSDLGRSWMKLNARFDPPGEIPGDRHFKAFAVLGEKIFAGTDRGVLVSTDQGASWRTENRGLFEISERSYTSISALIVSGNSIYAGTATSGVFRPGARLIVV